MKCARSHCYRLATRCRDDGLCWKHRREALDSERNKAKRAAREAQPPRGRPPERPRSVCVTCARETRVDKLRAGVCGVCRQKARTAARHAELATEAAAALFNVCSVTGCLRPRELERTCIEHRVSFDVRPEERGVRRAYQYAVLTMNPMEGT